MAGGLGGLAATASRGGAGEERGREEVQVERERQRGKRRDRWSGKV